jgi:hypothetical protein
MTTSTDILYIETDIPVGMTFSQYRATRTRVRRRRVFSLRGRRLSLR